MLKKAWTLGLLSIAALGMFSMSANADTAVVQQSTQDLYIEGEDNVGVQSSEQINIHRHHGGRGGRTSTGIVQDSYQGASVIGEYNEAYQENSQINVTERGRRTRHNGHQRGRIHIEQD